MKWKIYFTPEAQKNLKAIRDRTIQKKIVEKIEQMALDPEIESRGKELRGELSGLYSTRVLGRRYRIIYKLEKATISIIIINVGKREDRSMKDVYEITKKLLRLGLAGGK